MKGFCEALRTESLKAFRSRIFWISIFVFAFIAVMMGLLVFFSMNPELIRYSSLMSAKATLLGQSDWMGYFGLLFQVVALLGLVGFGFVAGWVFGREYSDRTVKDLLALPVSRCMIVSAKFVIVLVWSFVLAMVIFVSGIATGGLIDLEKGSAAMARQAFSVFTGTSLLTILVSLPVAFFASWGRGYLLPIAYVLLTMIITQFVVAGMPGLAPYFPWAVPALYCGAAGTEGAQVVFASYIIAGLTGAIGLTGTLAWWRYADQS